MRRVSRVDNNQREIVRALREAGATVTHLHAVGRGCPDLLVGYQGRTFLMEVKSARGVLTPSEHHWHQTWRGQVAIVRSAEEALGVLGGEA